MRKRFAIIGVAGYIAPRHMDAIKVTENDLLAALDKHDSVGIIDNYFPNASFFTEFERFDRHLEKLKRQESKIDYLTVCSPNYLHDAHIRFGLRYGSDVVCEKPIVLNPWNIDGLKEIEKETENKVFNILQLRYHENILKLKEKVDSAPDDKVFDVDLTYITSRGNWYFTSWKGNDVKSGGIATNIGIHFFDVLGWIFGKLNHSTVHLQTHDRAAGYLEYSKARVRWFLSINRDTLPKNVLQSGSSTYRTLVISGEEIDVSKGFEDLHLKSYTHILKGEGFGIETCRQSIETVYNIRHSEPIGLKGDYHPYAKFPLTHHPFSNSNNQKV
jgi:UDP-N-acetyl-2-amino-2-deoxyglucuronate dehydrogenase